MTRSPGTGDAALVISVGVVAMLIVSGIIERLAPPGEPLLYMVGAGIVAGLLVGGVASMIRRRSR